MQWRMTSRMAARNAAGRRLFLAGAHDGEFGGDAPCGGQQDVAGAAGDVGDAQVEQRLLRDRVP